MSILDDVLNKTKTAVDITAKKTGELVELTKANVKIMDTQNTIDKAFAEIGKMVYNSSKGRGDYAEEIEQKIAAIDELNEKLNELREEIASIKGIIVCRSCGKENSVSNAYCSACGSSLKD
jgi:rRNA maturation endonuclease Nob1